MGYIIRLLYNGGTGSGRKENIPDTQMADGEAAVSPQATLCHVMKAKHLSLDK